MNMFNQTRFLDRNDFFLSHMDPFVGSNAKRGGCTPWCWEAENRRACVVHCGTLNKLVAFYGTLSNTLWNSALRDTTECCVSLQYVLMDEPLTSQDIEHSPNDLSSCASRTELGAERPKVTTCHFDISEGELQWPARMLDEFEEEFFPRDFNSETRRNSCGPKVWPRAEIGHGRAKVPIDELARPQSSGEWDGGATSSRGRSFHPGSDVSPHRPELSWDPLKWIALHAAHTIHTTHRALPWGLVILFIFCVSGAMAESIPEETKVNTKGHVLVSIAELLRTHYAISTGFVLFLAALALSYVPILLSYLLFHALQDHWRPALLLADLSVAQAPNRLPRVHLLSGCWSVDEWAHHDKSGPTRA